MRDLINVSLSNIITQYLDKHQSEGEKIDIKRASNKIWYIKVYGVS